MLRRFLVLMSEIFETIGVGGTYSETMKEMLEECGLNEVQERRFLCQVGRNAKDELRERSIDGLASAVAPLAAVAKNLPVSFTEEELDGLEAGLRKELEREGGAYEMVVVWGQKV